MILEIVRAVGRRWYVVLVGIALTAGLVQAAVAVSPPEYHARALVLVLPSESAVGEGGNPFLALSGLEQPGSIVVAYFASSTAQAEVAEVSSSAEFAVDLDASTRGPVIALDVTDTSPAAAMATLDFLLQRVPAELERLQEQVGAPAASIITSMPIAVDTAPEVNTSGTLRMAIAAAGAGIVATVLLAFALDGVLLRRRARRAAADHSPDSDRPTRRRPRGKASIDSLPDRVLHDDERPTEPARLDMLLAREMYPVPARAGRGD